LLGCQLITSYLYGMITITVQISNKNTNTTEISVEKELTWSNGNPYTLEDYVIDNFYKNK